MPTKRTRMMRSSSTGDAEVVSPPPRPPPSASQDAWRQRRTPTINNPVELSINSADQSSRPPIFRIPSPVYDQSSSGVDSSRGVNITFDRCYHCTNNIPQDGDVFMYSLRAYCSEECREKHICIDEASTKSAENSKRGNDVFGPRPKRPNAP